MAFKLEDLINKKKEPTQILDLSKVKVKTKEDFEKYFDKIPEFKIRPEKVRLEDTKIRDTDFSFTHSKKEAKSKAKHEYTYGDPMPVSMKSVRLEDLVEVDISWRMLTMARPKNKFEEEFFNRLVELGKLRLSTRRQEQEQQQNSGGGGTGGGGASGGGSGGGSSGAVIPSNSPQALAQLGIIVTKNKRGVTETRVKSCKECGEELCTGQWCKEFPYDSYTRMILDKDELEKQEAEEKGVPLRRSSKLKTAAAATTGAGTLTKVKARPGGKKLAKKIKGASKAVAEVGDIGATGMSGKLKSSKPKSSGAKTKKKEEGTGAGAATGVYEEADDVTEPKKKVKRKKKKKSKVPGRKSDKTSDDSD